MTQRTAYDALGLNSQMGAVEVMEDPAVQATQDQARNPTQYRDVTYRASDDCHLGCSNKIAGGVTVGAGLTVVIEGVPTSPFKPKAVVVPSYLQIDLFMVQVTIGPFNAIEGDPVPVCSHSEVSLNQFVSWPTIQANSPIRFQLLNASAADKLHVAVDVRGLRLRE